MALAADLPLVVDEANLLNDVEVLELTIEAERISAEYAMDVVIVTVNSIGAKTVRDYAADYYDDTGYGQGPDNSGVMLILAMQSRDWYILTTGGAVRAFTDYGLAKIDEDVIRYLSDGNYEGGFARFLRDAEIFLQQDAAGKPYDANNHVQLKTVGERALAVLPWMLGASVLIAAVGLFVLTRGYEHRAAPAQRQPVCAGGFHEHHPRGRLFSLPHADARQDPEKPVGRARRELDVPGLLRRFPRAGGAANSKRGMNVWDF